MLMKNEEQLIRILEDDNGKTLIINCKQQSMPARVDKKKLNGYVEYGEEELRESISQYLISLENTSAFF